MCSGIVLLKYPVHILMLVKEGNDVIMQNIIPVVNGINSATIVISKENTFLPNVGIHFDVDQSG